MSKTRFFSVYKLPLVIQPNAFYYVYTAGVWESYLSDNKRKLYPIGNTEMINTLIELKIAEGGISNKEVKDYRSDFDAPSLFIYSGYHLNNVIVIKRVKDNTEEFAQGLTDLETDWTNRLTLTYI